MNYAYTLLDAIAGEWRRTPRYIDVDTGTVDAQWYADQGRWIELAGWGVYQEWIEPGDAPVGYDEPVVAIPDGETREYACKYIAGTEEEQTLATKQQMAAQIDSQVPDGGARQLVEDALFEGQIQSYSGGASERKSELEDTPAAELDSFDVTVVPTPLDGAGYVQAKMTTFIDIVDPWAGAPNDIYALRCVLKIITDGQEASGASARAHMFDEQGVDQGVMSFTQDPANSAIWETQSQVGRYWSDPEQGASMRLLWDSGSIAVAETKQLDGYGDRQYAIVRAGL